MRISQAKKRKGGGRFGEYNKLELLLLEADAENNDNVSTPTLGKGRQQKYDACGSSDYSGRMKFPIHAITVASEGDGAGCTLGMRNLTRKTSTIFLSTYLCLFWLIIPVSTYSSPTAVSTNIHKWCFQSEKERKTSRYEVEQCS